MKNNTSILKEKVMGSLDLIEKVCNETAKAWDKKSESIPIKLFSEIIAKSKWGLHPSNKIANDYISNFNKMIDLLEASSITSANSFKSESINLNYISQAVDILKVSFINGTKQK